LRSALVAGALLIGLGAASYGQDDTGPTEPQGACGHARDWDSQTHTLNIGYTLPASVNGLFPIHEPVVLSAQALHHIFLDVDCQGCGDFSNRYQENMTNIDYWFVDPTGRMSLSLVANHNVRKRNVLWFQTVLFHPEESIPVGQSRTYTIFARARNQDAHLTQEKDEDFFLEARYDIVVTRQMVTDTVPLMALEDHEISEARRERLVNQITVTTTNASGGGVGGFEEPATYCWPSWSFLPDSAIQGDFRFGSFGDPVSSVYAGDLLVATALGSDNDKMDVWCAGMNGCAPDFPERFDLPDTLRYSWTSSHGSFVGGSNRRDVAFLVPDFVGLTFRITLTITDSGHQAGDAPLVLRRDYTILDDSTVYGSACISIVDAADVSIPPNTLLAPATAVDTFYDWPQALQPALGTKRNMYRSTVGAWGYSNPLGFVTVPHPWYEAIKAFRASANPVPSSGMSSYDSLLSWTQGKEYRHLFAVQGRTLRRRDVVRELDVFTFQANKHLRAAVHEGWTPTRNAGFMDKALAESALGFNIEDYMEGAFAASKRTIVIRGEFTAKATVEMEDSFVLGPALATLQRLMTNRTEVWIDAKLVAPFPVQRTTQSTMPELQLADFPTHYVYVRGASGLFQLANRIAPVSTVEFIARGLKLNKKGI